MRLEFTLVALNGARRDLLAEADPHNTLGQLLAPYVRDTDPVFLGSTELDRAEPLAGSDLVNGSVVTVGSPRPSWPLDASVLAVMSGAAAGKLVPLGSSKVTIGRDTGCEAMIADPTISGRHASLTRVDDGWLLDDSGSTNGTWLRGARLRQKTLVGEGERFLLGSVACAVLAPRIDGAVEHLATGGIAFNRVPRYLEGTDKAKIAVPVQSGRGGLPMTSVVSSLAMAAAGVGGAFILGNWVYAAVGVGVSLLVTGITLVGAMRSRRREKARQADVASARDKAWGEAARAAASEEDHEWALTFDPATAHRAAIGPTSDLWSAMPGDDTAMLVRLGTVDRKAAVELTATEDLPSLSLFAVPATVDLRRHPVLGITGDDAGRSAAAIVHQLAISRSPDDLSVYFINDVADSGTWSWLRWLPHVRQSNPHMHQVANSATAVSDRLTELMSILDFRGAQASRSSLATSLWSPEILVVLSGAGTLRARPGIVRLLQEGPMLGIRILAVERVPSRLPAEIVARFSVAGNRSRLETKDAPAVDGITADLLADGVAEASARAVAPLIPLGQGDSQSMPSSVSLSDLTGLKDPTTSDIAARWSRGAGGDAAVAVDESGGLVSLSLDRDGPHALVAGTTGAGKSEFLRTWLLSMASTASPTNLTMLLIDFKGGGAFGKLRDLPHVVGYADNLSIAGALADRLLTSLRAELEYRQKLFQSAGNLSSLEEYRQARHARPDELPPLARLVICVDEFAELKTAVPDFIPGLVSVATVGRSLGVHLILATQRPGGGVITPQIADNSNLRVCLRVLESSSSMDLVGVPDAASIPAALVGRALVRTGGTPRLVQTAYTGGRTMDAPPDIEVPPPKVEELPWSSCGQAAVAAQRAETSDLVSDLTLTVDLLRGAADELGLPVARPPWLPPLPEMIGLSRLPRPEQRHLVAYGRQDNPGRQTQPLLTYGPGAGNLGFAGGRGSGRSSALRALAVALASAYSPDQLHLYVIDQSPAPALKGLAVLPHCGVAASRSEAYVTERLIRKLRELVASRGQEMIEAGSESFEQFRSAQPTAPPYVFVMVDGWDTLAAEQLEWRDALIQLAQDGPAVGIQLVVAGGRSLSTPRLMTALGDLICLPFEQISDMATFDVPVRRIPQVNPPGRGYRAKSPDAVQVAFLDIDEDFGRSLRTLAQGMQQPAVNVPMRLLDLPRRINSDEALARAREPIPNTHVVIGVGGDANAPIAIPLMTSRTPLVVTGPPGSGRTEALAALAQQLTRAGHDVFVRNVADADRDRFPGTTFIEEEAPTRVPPTAFVLVDDAGTLSPNDDLLQELTQRVPSRIAIAGTAPDLSGYSPWKNKLTGSYLVMLSPRSGEGVQANVMLRRELSFDGPPGRAWLAFGSRSELIQVVMVTSDGQGQRK